MWYESKKHILVDLELIENETQLPYAASNYF